MVKLCPQHIDHAFQIFLQFRQFGRGIFIKNVNKDLVNNVHILVNVGHEIYILGRGNVCTDGIKYVYEIPQ